jgi:hypothetical protein
MSIVDGGSRRDDVRLGSDRSFGLVFCGFFLIVALWPLVRGHEVRAWALLPSLLFLALALAYPRSLHRLNKIWFRIGEMLHHVVTPVVTGVIFFVALTPVAFIMRWRRRRDAPRPERGPYPSTWVDRATETSSAETMQNLF